MELENYDPFNPQEGVWYKPITSASGLPDLPVVPNGFIGSVERDWYFGFPIKFKLTKK